MGSVLSYGEAYETSPASLSTEFSLTVPIKALHDAHTWLDLLKSGKQITDITQATGLLDGTIWKRVRLACLSPKVQKAILNGTLNPEFTIRYLQSKRVPATWVEQDKLLISKVPC
jgi:hypothetical protein